MELLNELSTVVRDFESQMSAVKTTADVISNALLEGRKIMSCGNGGSACDALHLTEELIGRYKGNRKSLPGVCLNADVTAITCIGNDYGFEQIFSRQIQGIGKAGDVLVGFSTSGNSPNIIRALQEAKDKGILTIALTGGNGGSLKNIADWTIIVPSKTTARIQELHTFVLHYWLEQIENNPSFK